MDAYDANGRSLLPTSTEESYGGRGRSLPAAGSPELQLAGEEEPNGDPWDTYNKCTVRSNIDPMNMQQNYPRLQQPITPKKKTSWNKD